MDRHQELLDAALRKDDAEQRPEHDTARGDIETEAPGHHFAKCFLE